MRKALRFEYIIPEVIPEKKALLLCDLEDTLLFSNIRGLLGNYGFAEDTLERFPPNWKERLEKYPLVILVYPCPGWYGLVAGAALAMGKTVFIYSKIDAQSMSVGDGSIRSAYSIDELQALLRVGFPDLLIVSDERLKEILKITATMFGQSVGTCLIGRDSTNVTIRQIFTKIAYERGARMVDLARVMGRKTKDTLYYSLNSLNKHLLYDTRLKREYEAVLRQVNEELGD